MPPSRTQPVRHCPLFPEHCSVDCMERMRAEFGCYELSDPPFEQWCPFAKAAAAQDAARLAHEAEVSRILHKREFPNEPSA